MYNFDEIIERQGTNALNTDGFRDYIFHAGPEKTFPYKDDEFVRMWVADMEFATPDVIRDAIKERIDKKYSVTAWCIVMIIIRRFQNGVKKSIIGNF